MAFHLKFVFLIVLIFNYYHDAQGIALQRNWAPLESMARNVRQLTQENPVAVDNSLTNLAEPESTDASLTTTTIDPEFEDSETTGTTADATASPETLQSEFLRKAGGGFEGFIEKLQNHQLNKLDFLKNKFTTTSTISPPITTTPSVPIVKPSQPVTLPSYTIIKIVKFPCGPFLKCLLKKGKLGITTVPPTTTTTTTRSTTTTTTPRTTTTTTPRTTTTTTQPPRTITTTRIPITIGTPRIPVVTTSSTSTQASIALEAEEMAA